MIFLKRYHSRRVGLNISQPKLVKAIFTGSVQLEGGGVPLVLGSFIFEPSHYSVFGAVTLVTELSTTSGGSAASVKLINKTGTFTDVSSSVISTTSTTPLHLEAPLTLGPAAAEFHLTQGTYELELATAGGAGIFAVVGKTYLLISP